MEVRPYHASNEAFARTGDGLILAGYCQRAAAMVYEVLRRVVADSCRRCFQYADVAYKPGELAPTARSRQNWWLFARPSTGRS